MVDTEDLQAEIQMMQELLAEVLALQNQLKEGRDHMQIILEEIGKVDPATRVAILKRLQEYRDAKDTESST